MPLCREATRVPGEAQRARGRLVAGALLWLLASGVLEARAYAAERDPLDSPPHRPLVDGRRVFEQKGCAHCHGIWGEPGPARTGPDLGANGGWRDVMRLAGTLWNHAPAMIERMRAERIDPPTLTPDEMEKLAAYLFFVRFLGQPGSPEQGRTLFAERSCAHCHQLRGKGGRIGPRLDDLKDHVSSAFMARALWNHGPEMAAKMAELEVPRPRLAGDDVAHIVAVVRGGKRVGDPPGMTYLDAASPRSGKALFQKKGCTKCHTVAGRGGTVGPDLSQPRARADASEMAGALWNHGPPMWAKMRELNIKFPRLSDREMSDILSYLYFLQYMGGPGDGGRGGELFREKSCAQCHSAGGDGGTTGPDLAASDAVASTLKWVCAMWNHAPAMEAELRAAAVPWPRFAGDEMRDVVEFLRSRRPKQEGR